MKIFKVHYLFMLLLSFSVMVSCNDDSEEDETSQFVGDYTITKASLAAPLTLHTIEIGPLTAPANLDITDAITTSLLGTANCGAATDTYVEMREDYSLYYSCEGGNSLNAGTWEELSDTSLKLNLNGTAIPSSPSGFTLTVENIVVVGGVLSGTTSVPLPRIMLAGLVSQLSGGMANLDEAQTPEALVVSFNVEFTKK